MYEENDYVSEARSADDDNYVTDSEYGSYCSGGSFTRITRDGFSKDGRQEQPREVWSEAQLLQASLNGDTEAVVYLRDAIKRSDIAVYAASWLLENLGGSVSPLNYDELKSQPAEVGANPSEADMRWTLCAMFPCI
eukprot:1196123-Prorocentrum_minimum.AAC.11